MVELGRVGLTSRRLSFEFPVDSDATETAAAMNPNIARWLITWPSPMAEEEALEKIQAYKRGIDSGEAVHFVLRSLSNHAFVGWTSAWQDQAPDEWQIGFWIAEAFQGHGYGFESASTVLDYVIRSAAPRVLRTTVHPDNERSIAVLRKLGMEQIGETTRIIGNSCSEEPVLIFSRRLKP